MPHGPDSIETTFLDYLDRSRQYSEQVESAMAGQLSPDLASELRLQPIEEAATAIDQPAIPEPPESIPPLPSNLAELSTFTRFDQPQLLESFFGATGRTAKAIDTALATLNAPFEGLYNLIMNIPDSTAPGAPSPEYQRESRKSAARLAYIGSMFAPIDLGVTKGVKVLNTAARGAKVAGRAAEIAGEVKVAPATFAHIQKGFGDVPDYPNFTLTADIPGHPKGSTVSSKTLEDAGFTPPPVPENVGAAAAPLTARQPLRLGRNAVGEGERGFFLRSGEDLAASAEGHQFTNAPVGAMRYRLLEAGDPLIQGSVRGTEQSRAFFDIPWVINQKQFSLILRRSKGMDEIILDTPDGPLRTSTMRELRETLLPYVEKESFELAPEIAKTHAEFGGSTFNFTGQNLANTEGYAVSTFKNLEKVLDHAPSAKEVEDYIDGLPDVIAEQLSKTTKRGNWPKLSIGTWEDGGKHYLDVSQVETNYDRAMTLAVENKQKAIFDLKKMESISVEAQEFNGPGAAANKLAPGGTVRMNRAIERSAESMPSLQKAVDFFHAGEFNRDWYKGAFDELKKNFGDKADLMARLIAVTSPKTDVKDNVNLALKIFNQIAGKDTSKWSRAKWEKVASDAGVIYPSQYAPNIQRAVEGSELSGMKVSNFYRAITGDPNAVTVDAWMTRFYLGPARRQGSPGSGFGINDAEYALIRGRIVSGANALGVPPSEFQAAIWSAQKMIADPAVVKRLDKGELPADVMPHLAEFVKRGMAEAEKNGLLSPKATTSMKATMGLAVAMSMGLLPKGNE